MSNIFDTHCHLQFPHYDLDREEVIRRGVPLICAGTDIKTSKQAIELAKHPGVWAAVGAHPNDLDDLVMDDFIHLMNEEKVVAVGEVGLDYYRTKGDDKQKKQRDAFEQFINLAYQYKKPLVLHCRDAHKDAIKILKSAKDLLYGGVAHSFTGTLEEAREYLSIGFYLGFNGIITFARQYDEIIVHTSLEKILLETDAPYLTPEPYRGKRNEPAYVLEVAKKIAELKHIPTEKVINITTQNVLSLFKIVLKDV
ncbi:MAG: TatD family hydrolase [Candidatus Yanofskybacteria bacterium]|nr:TatD family hydrolase [Candidatus Yanofskybacteria bacterium]